MMLGPTTSSLAQGLVPAARNTNSSSLRVWPGVSSTNAGMPKMIPYGLGAKAAGGVSRLLDAQATTSTTRADTNSLEVSVTHLQRAK
jgi:hypothetical protein